MRSGEVTTTKVNTVVKMNIDNTDTGGVADEHEPAIDFEDAEMGGRGYDDDGGFDED